MHYVCMRAVWDPDKAKANLEKHGVRFSDAELVLYDPYAVTVEDAAAQGEQRHISIGMDAVGAYSGGGVHLPRRERSADLGSVCDAKRKATI